jgi:hypothetical protein
MPLAPSASAEEAPAPPSSGGWLYADPSRAGLNRLGAFGLLKFLGIALFFAGLPLSPPFTREPWLRGLLYFFAPLGGLATALALHLVCLPFRYGLTSRSWLVVPLLYVGLPFAGNALALQWEWEGIQRAIAEGSAGEPEIAPDEAFKAALLEAISKLRESGNRKVAFSVRIKERHEKEITPAMKASLALWKLDPDFAHVRGDVPGAEPSFRNLGAGHIEDRLRDALKAALPKGTLDEGLIPNRRQTDRVVFDIEASTLLVGTYTKYKNESVNFGGVSLSADFRVEWKVRLLGHDGAELYSSSWTTRPASGLSFKVLGLDGTPGSLVQLSAHDNFARQLLGHLGLPPGPERKEWSYQDR